MKDFAEKHAEVADLLTKGFSRDDACIVAGIDRSTFYRWLSKNETFATQITQSEVRNKARAILLVQQAGITDWRAASWWLERRYPKEFNLKYVSYDETPRTFLDILSSVPIENQTDRMLFEQD